MVIVLFLLGGKVLQPFSFALIVGVVVGTYSSLFIATPAMLILENRYKLEDINDAIYDMKNGITAGRIIIEI